MADGKKQVPLRLSLRLYEQLAAWAEDDFRSVNGQIEYLLSDCVRNRRKRDRQILSSSKEEDEARQGGGE
ncbi:MAG: PTS ascorbate transporter subunit IIC [Christensenellales bacterium]